MNSLVSTIRTEWLKIKYYKPLWVLLGLYPLCLGGIVAMFVRFNIYAQSMAHKIPQGEAALAAHPPFGFPHAWHMVAYIASWMQFMPALLLILNVTNEFTFRSHRQNLLEGWSRARFLGAKVLLAAGVTLYGTATLVPLTLLAAAFSGFAPSPEGSEYLAYFAVQTFLYSVFALFLAFLIRRAALALAAFLIYSTMLESIVSFFVNLRTDGYGSFLPLKVVNALVPAPFLKEAVQEAAQRGSVFYQPPTEVLLVAAAVYLALFLGLTWSRFRREDL